jgi:putative Ca2+/H+ antiporter (TMEM165/GDT1 family)
MENTAGLALTLSLCPYVGWVIGDVIAKKVKVKKLRKRIAEGYYANK